MQIIDKDIDKCIALVVDSNPVSRSILISQLKDFGMPSVMHCTRPDDVMELVTTQRFDLVLCESTFAGSSITGHGLLDNLRKAKALPLTTVFIMITGECSYARVAESAESALDGYLLKPHTALQLGERIRQSRRLKKALAQVYAAIDAELFELAAELCLRLYNEKGPYWLHAARIGAELLLNLGRHEVATNVYNAVIESKALPWARLGLARVQADSKELGKASRTLESLLADEPTYSDAYDVMGRVQLERGNLEKAMGVFQQAAALTPDSVDRLQKVGLLAYYQGNTTEAGRCLQRALAIGGGTRLFDHHTLVLLALVRFVQRDSKGLQRCCDDLSRELARAEDSPRLKRFVAVVQTLVHLTQKRPAEVVASLRELAQGIGEPSFDFEAGCDMVSLMATVRTNEIRLDDGDDWLETIALRHCSSKTLTDLLAASASADPPLGERIKEVFQEVGRIREKGVGLVVAGDPSGSVRQLLQDSHRTKNQRLIYTAESMLQRHRDKIPEAEAMQTDLDQLLGTYCSESGLVAKFEKRRLPAGIKQRAPGAAALEEATEA